MKVRFLNVDRRVRYRLVLEAQIHALTRVGDGADIVALCEVATLALSYDDSATSS